MLASTFGALVLLVAACAARQSSPAPVTAEAAPAPDGPLLMQGLLVEGPFPAEPAATALGSDRSDLPDRYPDGSWVEVEGGVLSMQLPVTVEVNGAPAVALLDTGAMTSVLSSARAELLGVDMDQAQSVNILDAHGDIVGGARADLGSLQIGTHRWQDVLVTVIEHDADIFLIGEDVLQDVDLYLAADEGLIGLFEAGRAPRPAQAETVTLRVRDRQLRVDAEATGGDGEVRFGLILDTGASATSIPADVGVRGRLPADATFETRTMAVGGEMRSRGRFVLDPMRLGPERVPVPGAVYAAASAMERGRGAGLLGNDVLTRQRTVISFARGQLLLGPLPDRPPLRTRGPDGAPCFDAVDRRQTCIFLRLEPPPDGFPRMDAHLSDLVLRVRVDDAYASHTLELALLVNDEDGAPALGGGALRALVTVGRSGLDTRLPIPAELASMGLSEQSRLSLMWVRAEGLTWSCDPLLTHCLRFTGPQTADDDTP